MSALYNINPIVMDAGTVRANIIFKSTVKAPYKPATVIHPKKKSAILLRQVLLAIKKVQINPAAKKPLYKP
jgi:hypothetical protein